MDNLHKYLIQDSLIRNVKKYGIEGTEDKIKEVYTHNVELKNAMIENLHKLYNFGGK